LIPHFEYFILTCWPVGDLRSDLNLLSFFIYKFVGVLRSVVLKERIINVIDLVQKILPFLVSVVVQLHFLFFRWSFRLFGVRCSTLILLFHF
jgi:hypothetical protein